MTVNEPEPFGLSSVVKKQQLWIIYCGWERGKGVIYDKDGW